MHRTEDADREQDLFGAGLDGFTDGDSELEIPATSLSAAEFNSYQQEMCNLVVDAGFTVLTEATDTFDQVSLAVRTISASSVGHQVGSNGYVVRGLTASGDVGDTTYSLSTGSVVITGQWVNIPAQTGLTLAANDRDNYVFVRSDDFTIEVVDVPVGDPLPFPLPVPTGSVSISVIETDSSGEIVSITNELNRGPRLTCSTGEQVALEQEFGSTPSCLHPVGTVDLGQRVDGDVSRRFNEANVQHLSIQSSAAVNLVSQDNVRFTRSGSTTNDGFLNLLIDGAPTLLLNNMASYVTATVLAVRTDDDLTVSSLYGTIRCKYTTNNAGTATVADVSILDDGFGTAVLTYNFAGGGPTLRIQGIDTQNHTWFVEFHVIAASF